jgi:hypothetical protein
MGGSVAEDPQWAAVGFFWRVGELIQEGLDFARTVQLGHHLAFGSG